MLQAVMLRYDVYIQNLSYLIERAFGFLTIVLFLLNRDLDCLLIMSS